MRAKTRRGVPSTRFHARLLSMESMSSGHVHRTPSRLHTLHHVPLRHPAFARCPPILRDVRLGRVGSWGWARDVTGRVIASAARLPHPRITRWHRLQVVVFNALALLGWRVDFVAGILGLLGRRKTGRWITCSINQKEWNHSSGRWGLALYL